ncbi:MAG: hypothetical protein AAFQ05_01025 [Pseudomonadota bacterium]
MSAPATPPEPGSSRDWARIHQSFKGRSQNAMVIASLSSASASAVGLASLNPGIAPDQYLLIVLMGGVLWILLYAYSLALFQTALLEKRSHIAVAVLIVLATFPPIVLTSGISNLGAIAYETSVIDDQVSTTDEIKTASDTSRQFIGNLSGVEAGLRAQADQAVASQAAEIAGDGPSGQAGSGPVSRSFGEAELRYREAADVVAALLTDANEKLSRVDALIVELRLLQADQELDAPQRAAQLAVLHGQALAELRGVVALDPPTAIRTLAASIARGVPEQAGANRSARQRIAEINGNMAAYAALLLSEADRVATILPELPVQVTRTPTQQLMRAAIKKPAHVALAVLIDVLPLALTAWRWVIVAAYRDALKREQDAREKAKSGRSTATAPKPMASTPSRSSRSGSATKNRSRRRSSKSARRGSQTPSDTTKRGDDNDTVD